MASSKVEKLKNCFTVESVPLFKSNRFTQEEYTQLCKDSGAHTSHYYGLLPTSKTFSDTEIEDQINTLMNQPYFKEGELTDKINDIFSNLPLVDRNKEKLQFKIEVYKLLNWDKLVPLDPLFWRKFGSAPFMISDTNKKLVAMKNKYGACGMREIFGDKFEKTYSYSHTVENHISQFDAKWEQFHKLKKESESIYTSEFKDINDLEENVTVKKMPVEAKKFYMDKTKDFKQRCDVFSKYAKKIDSIWEPSNPTLKKIFEIHNESDWIERHQDIECVYVIEHWIYNLTENRCKLDWINPYHPKIKKSIRGYNPSKKAISRLERYYTEKLFLEGVGSFEFDW